MLADQQELGVLSRGQPVRGAFCAAHVEFEAAFFRVLEIQSIERVHRTPGSHVAVRVVAEVHLEVDGVGATAFSGDSVLRTAAQVIPLGESGVAAALLAIEKRRQRSGWLPAAAAAAATATTAAATATTAAAAATLSLLRLVYAQGATIVIPSVELTHGACCAFVFVDFDEAEASGASGFPVGDHTGRSNAAVSAEHGFEFLVTH